MAGQKPAQAMKSLHSMIKRSLLCAILLYCANFLVLIICRTTKFFVDDFIMNERKDWSCEERFFNAFLV